MEMSYQEKSITGSLIAILLAYGYYFAAVLRHLGEPELVGSTLGRLSWRSSSSSSSRSSITSRLRRRRSRRKTSATSSSS